MALKFRTQYDPTPKVIKHIEGPSLTDPSYGKECDIGFMIENYRVNKIPLPTVNVQYGNSMSADDYLQASQMVAELKTQFESLPSKERDEFGNVENYLKFIGNPDNLKSSYERGLIDRSSVDLSVVYPERSSDKIDEKLSKEGLVEPSDKSVSGNANS